MTTEKLNRLIEKLESEKALFESWQKDEIKTTGYVSGTTWRSLHIRIKRIEELKAERDRTTEGTKYTLKTLANGAKFLSCSMEPTAQRQEAREFHNQASANATAKKLCGAWTVVPDTNFNNQ